jgi:hypothetical protein
MRRNTAEHSGDTLAAMTRKKPDDDLLEMAEQLQSAAGGRGRRSPQFQWLFKRLGITNGSGKHPTRERTRKTWTEVRRAKRWLDLPPRVTAPSPQPAPSQPLREPPERPPAQFDEPPARTFGTGRLCGRTRAVLLATPTVHPPSRAPILPDRSARARWWPSC